MIEWILKYVVSKSILYFFSINTKNLTFAKNLNQNFASCWQILWNFSLFYGSGIYGIALYDALLTSSGSIITYLSGKYTHSISFTSFCALLIKSSGVCIIFFCNCCSIDCIFNAPMNIIHRTLPILTHVIVVDYIQLTWLLAEIQTGIEIKQCNHHSKDEYWEDQIGP